MSVKSVTKSKSATAGRYTLVADKGRSASSGQGDKALMHKFPSVQVKRAPSRPSKISDAQMRDIVKAIKAA